jgi:hypothetical protein
VSIERHKTNSWSMLSPCPVSMITLVLADRSLICNASCYCVELYHSHRADLDCRIPEALSEVAGHILPKP